MGVPRDEGKPPVMAMSFYPNEAEPLWSQYSTEAVAHTLEVYGRYTFAYPYSSAISVNGPVYGMEYPMLCFNGPRPEDGWDLHQRHQVRADPRSSSTRFGHNFFPMIVNSDERQWTWMDEGLNTFLQYLAEQEWEEDYPSRRGPPEKIVAYMRGGNQRPIMTGSEEILQFGHNAYGKPRDGAEHLARNHPGPRTVRLCLSPIRQAVEIQTPDPQRFLPNHGRRLGGGPGLVLARDGSMGQNMWTLRSPI